MSADPRGPVQIVQRGSDYFRAWRPICQSDNLYLKPGETDWHGPFPEEGNWANDQLHELDRCARRFKSLGKACPPLHVQKVGPFIRTRHLGSGPVKKLSDWLELSPGVPMLVDPKPTFENSEKVLNRIRYLKHRKGQSFRSWTDDAGALWVERT